MTQQMMWITFVPAIVGLLGVLVGAAITAWANYWLAVRKEKAGEAKDKLSRAIVSDEEKIEIDFRRKETEEGWIRIHYKFGLKGKGIPMVSTGRRQQIASLLLSGVIACLFGWLAITIASKLAALQQSR